VTVWSELIGCIPASGGSAEIQPEDKAAPVPVGHAVRLTLSDGLLGE
jgi:hypothetical protein